VIQYCQFEMYGFFTGKLSEVEIPKSVCTFGPRTGVTGMLVVSFESWS